MTTIKRHDDVFLNDESPYEDQIPEGLVLFEGKQLQILAKFLGTPFGTATRRKYEDIGKSKSRIETVGLIVDPAGREQLIAGLKARAKKKAGKP